MSTAILVSFSVIHAFSAIRYFWRALWGAGGGSMLRGPWQYAAIAAVSNAVISGTDLFVHAPADAGIGLAVTAFWSWIAYQAWKNRNDGKRKKKVLRAIGNKGRKALRALARNMPRITPPLQPVPVRN